MASIFQTFPLLRKAAPRLAREFFTCRAHRAHRVRLPKHTLPSIRSQPFFQSFRHQTTQVPRHTTSPLREAIDRTAQQAGSSKSWFPETSSKIAGYWLLGSAASVFGIVVFGGLTRLTESGLSITEWRPVTGSLPPFNPEQWESEFTKYRSSPEFKLLNPRMTLEEFKQIYWMEWTHRLWGRVIGVTFLLPTIYFIARRKVSAPMAWKLSGICGLIGFQGFIGWWMVKSGLKDDLFAPGSHPRVSQYRLTTHLGTAFIVYASMLLSGLSILREHRFLRDPSAALSKIAALKNPQLRTFKLLTTALTVLVFTTAMSGALVAGLDAGLIYNEFPYMGLGLTPPAKELWDPFYSHTPDKSDLWWRNMLENPSLVQLDHRILATSTFCAIMALFAYGKFNRGVRGAMPRDVKKGLTGVVHLAWMQVLLGISTLVYLVPTWLAAGHQAGALALLTGALILRSRLHVSPRTVRLLEKAAAVQRSALGPGGLRKGVGLSAESVEQKIV